MTDTMKNFWDNRLSQQASLIGTGHRAFNLAYNKALYAMQSDTLDILLNSASVSITAKKVLDIGSGIGYYVDYFSRRGVSDITGIDIAPSSVTYLEDRFPQYTFQCVDIGSVTGLPVADNFDIVSAISVLYHIVDDEEFNTALKNIFQTIVPGGYFIVTDMFRETLQLTASHAKFRTLKNYQPAFDKFNMKVIDVLPMYYFMNRTYIPYIMPKILQLESVTRILKKIDTNLRRKRVLVSAGLQAMLVQRAL